MPPIFEMDEIRVHDMGRGRDGHLRENRITIKKRLSIAFR